MDHHPGIVQGDQALGLVAVGEEGAGHGLAHQQADHRVAGEAGAGIGVHRAGQGLVNPQGLLTAAVGLAGYVHQRHQYALGRQLAVGLDGLIHRLGQAPALQQADLTIAGAREGILRIRHHGDEARGTVAQFAVHHLHRSGKATNRFAAGKAAQPVQSTAHCCSPW
ncbi:hypothetical protein D3C84_699770 [compost metagenome]